MLDRTLSFLLAQLNDHLGTRYPSKGVCSRCLSWRGAYFLYKQQSSPEQRKVLEYGAIELHLRSRNVCPTYKKPFNLFVRGNETGELAGSTGLEPAASGVTGRRSNQLNYDPKSIQ